MPAKYRADPAGLPPAGVGFVGRERELDHIGSLLMGPTRLVTLIGPGGIGKTRLAEEAARRLHRARCTPVFTVRLARLPKGSDAAAVKEAVTAAVLVEGFVGAAAWDGAVQRLAPLDATERVVPTMLLLDNCEHLLAGAGAVIVDLLDEVPGLTILATSREPVGYADEQLEVVPPLSARQSLELFRQRAELADRPITEPGQVALAEQVCGRMHGHPLCIRLAAARMFYEPLSMILEQLSGESDDARMQWSHGPRAGLDSRHQAIGDVIAWSYELCGDKQRLLFDRLSVFAPGYDVNPDDAETGLAGEGADLEAIEVICADDVLIEGCQDRSGAEGGDQTVISLARTEIRELLDRLVEQSLVSIHITADTVRYFLLESLRLFAEDRLAKRATEQVDEPARLAVRHCYYYRDKTLCAQAEWFGPAGPEMLSWAVGAWSNILRAIDTSLHIGQPVVGLQVATTLHTRFALGSAEIRSRIGQTLAAMPVSGPRLTELQLYAMSQAAWLALIQGCTQEGEELLERCVAGCDVDAADAVHWRDRPEIDIGLPAMVDSAWGLELMLVRRDPRAIAVFKRALEKFQGTADQLNVAACGTHEAMAAGLFGSAEQALTIAHRHLEWATAAGVEWARSWAQIALAIALTKHGDAEEALRVGRDALAYLMPLGDQWGTIWAVHIRMWSLARLISDQSPADNASGSSLVKLATEIAYLAGGAKAQRDRLGVLIANLGPFADETKTAEEVARDVLGQKAYADVEKRGSRLFIERSELEGLALGTLSISTWSPAAKSTSSWKTLSAAEREVAILAAAGWPNSAIGVRRGTATKTTDTQMAAVFQKLMIDSREDIVRFVPSDQRDRVSAERSQIPRRNRDKSRSTGSRPSG